MPSKLILNFLKDLSENNQRDWFLSNKENYSNAKQEFIAFIENVLKIVAKKSKAYGEIDPIKTLFRINRDVRFSPNKAPYKTNFGASLNLYGKKSFKAGLYIHIEPGGSFVGGGIYMPPADILYKVRQEIDYNFNSFLKIIKHKDFVAQYGQLDMSDALKNPPKGFNAENPAIAYIKLKSFVSIAHFSDKELVNKDFTNQAAAKLIALLPLIDFLNNSLDD
jgi:uncharacterized protein (TIGR02453 family)